MQNQKSNAREIMLKLDSMKEIAIELHNINHDLDKWRGSGKRIFAQKYEVMINELMESLEHSLQLSAALTERIN